MPDSEQWDPPSPPPAYSPLRGDVSPTHRPLGAVCPLLSPWRTPSGSPSPAEQRSSAPPPRTMDPPLRLENNSEPHAAIHDPPGQQG